MSAPTVYGIQGLLPAHDSPQAATTRAVALPWGGPTDAGGSYDQGLLLGNVGGTAQAEIWVITTTLADNTWKFLFYGDRVYSTPALAYNVSTTVLQAALEDIFGVGTLVVTGTAGSSYTITFQAPYSRIGGNIDFTETASSGSISIARSQRGSCGAGQYDVYDNSAVTKVNAILQYLTTLAPTGAIAYDVGTGSGPYPPSAYLSGFFYADDLPNIDSSAVTNAGTGLSLSVGSSVTADGAIVWLGQFRQG